MTLYRATVIDDSDPVQRSRLLISLPDWGNGNAWAEACLPLGPYEVPRVGDTVWVAFEGGDTNYPVWLGVTAVPLPPG